MNTGEGIVPLLKPPGMSSSDGVVFVRRLFEQKRVGHLGTLDPGAAGVLPVCVGRAVRLFDYLVDKDKTYRFELILGTATDTHHTHCFCTLDMKKMEENHVSFI